MVAVIDQYQKTIATVRIANEGEAEAKCAEAAAKAVKDGKMEAGGFSVYIYRSSGVACSDRNRRNLPIDHFLMEA
jgi:hypothetical protein